MTFDTVKDFVSFFNDLGGLISLIVTTASLLLIALKKNALMATCYSNSEEYSVVA